MKELYVIINEKIFKFRNDYFCENKDIQSIINFLSYKYSLFILSRNSESKKPFKLSSKNKFFNFNFFKIFNFFLFLFKIKKTQKKVLIISITPFNFFFFIFFFIFYNCKFYLYLRSNGYEEYENILGKKYIWIYDLMFRFMTKHSVIISCHKRLFKKKAYILSPSELTEKWKRRIKKNNFAQDTINILYVGRFKIEKGVYSLLDIFHKLPKNIKLFLVGSGDFISPQSSRIKVLNFITNEKKLINIYDNSNIVILPSFTEAHPKVIDEALCRFRPVVIFNDIKYVVQDRYGVFSVKRNASQLLKIITYIKKNNNLIFSQMNKNKLPTKKSFLFNLARIVGNN